MKLVNIEDFTGVRIIVPKDCDKRSFLAGAGAVMDRLHSAEVIDAVPIVRCKDCVRKVEITDSPWDAKCLFWGRGVDSGWFCRFGKRSDEEGENAK